MRIKNVSKKNMLYKILFCIVFGSIIGSILANNMNQEVLIKINSSVEKFFSDSTNTLEISKFELLTREFFKHGKIIIFIWLMAFIPLGKIFIYFSLLVKGICYGFSSSIIFSVYKQEAILKILKYILPQNFFLLLITIFISYCSMANIFQYKSRYKNNILEYFFILTISLMCMFLVLLIDTYLLM